MANLAEPGADQDESRVAQVHAEYPQIFRKDWHGEALYDHLMKSPVSRKEMVSAWVRSTGTKGASATLVKGNPYVVEGEAASSMEIDAATKEHPFNMSAVKKLIRDNDHHSTCIHTKVASAVGLGHTNEETGKKLDALTGQSWLYTLTQVAYDYFQVANAYIEVVRGDPKDPRRITGLYHVPAEAVTVVVEDDLYNIHYLVGGTEEEWGGIPKIFAAYGDLEDLHKRIGAKQSVFLGGTHENSEIISELIHIRMPNTLSRWYGFPDWLSAAASIELVQMMIQESFDFFYNRGVPEFILFLLGKRVEDDNWNKITTNIQATVGPGNQHKTMAVNLTDPNVKVQLEKLAIEGKSGGAVFKEMQEVLGLNIVTAHRIPPILGGIQIPGKMGAANEMQNALLVTQVLVVGPAQKQIESVLNATLGNSETNDLGLGDGAFEFAKINEVIAEGMEALQPADTMARMRQEAPEAAAEGRDMEDGLKKLREKLKNIPGVDMVEVNKALARPAAVAQVGGAVLGAFLDLLEQTRQAA
jgi:hypothetical protein